MIQHARYINFSKIPADFFFNIPTADKENPVEEVKTDDADRKTLRLQEMHKRASDNPRGKEPGPSDVLRQHYV